MAKLDSLVVDLQVNTAQLKQGLDKANEHLDEFSHQLGELADKAKEFGEVVVFEIGKEAVEALGEFVIAGAEVADQMGKIARATPRNWVGRLPKTLAAPSTSSTRP
jgi:hypothetical protein